MRRNENKLRKVTKNSKAKIKWSFFSN